MPAHDTQQKRPYMGRMAKEGKATLTRQNGAEHNGPLSPYGQYTKPTVHT